LTIATAANMQFAMQDLTRSFTEQTGTDCEIIVSSSGKLTAQIKEGAPYDVFVSADMKFPNELVESGFTRSKTTVYAYGKLIIWSMTDHIDPSFELLKSEEIRHVAMPNPKTAPYGRAALEALIKNKIYEEIKGKLVFGESVAQTNQFIYSKAAEIGFTAKSIVFSPNMKGKGTWKEIDSDLYAPIAQGIVLLKNRETHRQQSQDFYNFLLSGKGKEILIKFGYSIDK